MLKGGYLKVLTPVTSDGTSLVMTEDGPDGKKIYKESQLNLNAKKIMEAKNAKLPPHLRHIITVITDEPNGAQQVNENGAKRTKEKQKVIQ